MEQLAKTIAKIAVIFLGTLCVDDMRIFLLSKCNQLLKAATSKLNEILPDAINAADRARSVLEHTKGWDGKSLLNGLTFSDLANLAKNLDVVTSDEREHLTLVNDRRNDAAHFRPVGYDDAFKLEQIVRDLLPVINARMSEIVKD